MYIHIILHFNGKVTNNHHTSNAGMQLKWVFRPPRIYPKTIAHTLVPLFGTVHAVIIFLLLFLPGRFPHENHPRYQSDDTSTDPKYHQSKFGELNTTLHFLLLLAGPVGHVGPVGGVGHQIPGDHYRRPDFNFTTDPRVPLGTKASSLFAQTVAVAILKTLFGFGNQTFTAFAFVGFVAVAHSRGTHPVATAGQRTLFVVGGAGLHPFAPVPAKTWFAKTFPAAAQPVPAAIGHRARFHQSAMLALKPRCAETDAVTAHPVVVAPTGAAVLHVLARRAMVPGCTIAQFFAVPQRASTTVPRAIQQTIRRGGRHFFEPQRGGTRVRGGRAHRSFGV